MAENFVISVGGKLQSCHCIINNPYTELKKNMRNGLFKPKYFSDDLQNFFLLYKKGCLFKSVQILLRPGFVCICIFFMDDCIVC